jgi:hypothetical protein
MTHRIKLPIRVCLWSLGLGAASGVLTLKEVNRWGAGEVLNMIVSIIGGSLVGALVGYLITAYEQRRRTAFHVWGWALLISPLGLTLSLAFGVGIYQGLLLGGLFGALFGSVLLYRVSGDRR